MNWSADSDPGDFLDLAGPLLARLESTLVLPMAEQISAWQDYYLDHAPDLLDMLCADYEGQHEGGWRSIAATRIFPKLPELLPGMKVAMANLKKVYPVACRAKAVLGLTELPLLVAYVGLGNGAGWATTWRGRTAVLLGLENVAELGWQNADKLEGLIGHELGHVFMMQIRGSLDDLTEDPLLIMYEEGFAQHCEHILAGRETWHCSSQAGWLEWCSNNEQELASRYLSASKDRSEWRQFFGSWFEVQGWRQTGYFLGCRFVQQQTLHCSLADLAGWSEEKIKNSVVSFLLALASEPTR